MQASPSIECVTLQPGQACSTLCGHPPSGPVDLRCAATTLPQGLWLYAVWPPPQGLWLLPLLPLLLLITRAPPDSHTTQRQPDPPPSPPDSVLHTLLLCFPAASKLHQQARASPPS